ncbi:MAG: hypothetical protein QG635_1447 [Bacteroidota bacterium]|nr:hypothetical protein [Bacteroidota bacterium]
MKFIVILIFLVSTISVFSQTLHDDISRIYNFKPGSVKEEVRNAKSKEMDKFWDKIINDKSKYINELKYELGKTGNPEFFYFDGGLLLLQVGESKEDTLLAIKCVQGVDLNDVDPLSFIKIANKLAISGYDVSDIALKVIRQKDFTVFLPLHSMTLEADQILLYQLFPTHVSLFDEKLCNEYLNTKSDTLKSKIAIVIWLANSCKGNLFIKDIMNNINTPNLIKKTIKEIEQMLDNPNIQSYIKVYKSENLKELKTMRDKELSKISDEALDNIVLLSLILKTKSECN